MMRRIAAAANHDIARQGITAHATVRFFQELRLLPRDKLDARRHRQADLIGQSARPLDKRL